MSELIEEYGRMLITVVACVMIVAFLGFLIHYLSGVMTYCNEVWMGG